MIFNYKLLLDFNFFLIINKIRLLNFLNINKKFITIFINGDIILIEFKRFFLN